jgi:4-amino-4-deoxy-L-arabinose transferase-like glycosyltransferase
VTAGSVAAGRVADSAVGRRIALHWHRAALAAVLLLASLLDFLRLGRNGWANAYYSAAVHSMLRSWHNFLFASFDPGGLVSVDKPPLALWVEAASAKLFGYSGVAILAPEALAGVAAVWLLYLLVARHFGRVPGLVAALALAVSPVSVAVNRDNNPDALFVFLLVAAAWAGARAVESARLRRLVGCALLVGLAFNTKMLAAGIVVPGLALAFLLFARTSLRTRIRQLAVAGTVLAVVSAAWIAAVDLTPAADRPYVGSTTDNSALSLALGYNGLGRVEGQTGGTSFGGGLGGAFSGTPGFFRLLNDALGDQGAWLLALAIVGAVSAAIWAVRHRRAQLGPLVLLGGWFLAGAIVFSYSSGIIHTYYLSALAPATSALAGIGVVSLARDARRAGPWAAIPLLAVVFSAWMQVALLHRSGYLPWLVGVVIGASIVAGIALVALAVFPEWRMRGHIAAAALTVAAAGFFAAPAAWAESTQKAAVDGVFPGAGPSYFGGGFGRPGGFAGGTADVDAALAYVVSHGAASRFALIVSSELEAAPYVIAGKPVSSMGGFTGRETVLTNPFLASLLRKGEARFFLLGGQGGIGPGGGANAAASTIASTCTAVPGASWGARGSAATLYDCAGKGDAIAALG